MEVDAFLILVLSAYVAQSFGAWVLTIGAARYTLVAAGWLLPWLRESPPPRYWYKFVAALEGSVLTVVIADMLPGPGNVALLTLALVLLGGSFGHEIWWLWQNCRINRVACAASSDRARCRGGSRSGWGVRMSIADQPLRTDRIDGPSEPASSSAATPPTSGRWARARTVATWVMTVLAALLVWFALVAPDRLDRLGPGAFVRIPIEGLVIVALSVILPPRARRILAIVVGLALGLLTVVKILDIGFFVELDRPFNPVTDWSFFGPAAGVLRDSVGQTCDRGSGDPCGGTHHRAARPRAAVGVAADRARRASSRRHPPAPSARSDWSGFCAPSSASRLCPGGRSRPRALPGSLMTKPRRFATA